MFRTHAFTLHTIFGVTMPLYSNSICVKKTLDGMIHIRGFTLQALNYILAFWFSKTFLGI
jgi:hypothetical protein